MSGRRPPDRGDHDWGVTWPDGDPDDGAGTKGSADARRRAAARIRVSRPSWDHLEAVAPPLGRRRVLLLAGVALFVTLGIASGASRPAQDDLVRPGDAAPGGFVPGEGDVRAELSALVVARAASPDATLADVFPSVRDVAASRGVELRLVPTRAGSCVEATNGIVVLHVDSDEQVEPGPCTRLRSPRSP